MDNAVATVRSIRDVPPAHYSIKLTSFLLFLDADIGNYTSGVFEAGGYKWKLCIHPNGNEKMNVGRHISLHLVIADTEILPPGWEVNFNFKLFVFDQIRDAERVIRRFHNDEDRMAVCCWFCASSYSWGFPEFMALSDLNDASKGSVVNDVLTVEAQITFISSTKDF